VLSTATTVCVKLAAKALRKVWAMMRKVLILLAGVLAMLTLWTGVASAQASPASVLPTSTVKVEGESLARTGTNSMPMIYAGAALAAGGVVLVVAARRRRRHHLAVQ